MPHLTLLAGVYNFEFGPTFLENLWATELHSRGQAPLGS